MRGDDPWFVAKDVGTGLGIANSRDAIVRLKESEKKMSESPTPSAERNAQRSLHTLTETFRLRALENLRRVPDGYFSVMGELFKHLYNLQALFQRSLDEHAMIELSVGLRWAKYAREVVNFPDQHRCKYAHSMCQGGRIEQVWAYALHYVTTFDKWLWEFTSRNTFPTMSATGPGIVACLHRKPGSTS